VPFVTNATGKVANLNADKLDDKSAEDFADKSEVLFAAVAEGGTLGGNRGATASTRNNATTTTVTFNRDVSKCSFTATANGTAPDVLAAQVAAATGAGANQVVVTEGDGVTATAFHLQVIC
jgi:kynureninase